MDINLIEILQVLSNNFFGLIAFLVFIIYGSYNNKRFTEVLEKINTNLTKMSMLLDRHGEEHRMIIKKVEDLEKIIYTKKMLNS